MVGMIYCYNVERLVKGLKWYSQFQSLSGNNGTLTETYAALIG